MSQFTIPKFLLYLVFLIITRGNHYTLNSDVITTRSTSRSRSTEPHLSTDAPKIIIGGGPASGKGTQCEIISMQFGVVHLSSGDILREAVKGDSYIGRIAQKYMDEGKLVPDDVIIEVINERLKQDDCQKRGWLLDGFPRTKYQAEALLKAKMVPDAFIVLEVPDYILIDRVCGRRMDPLTGKIYNLKYDPPTDEAVRTRLMKRSDDDEEKIKTRILDYKAHIEAVKSYFSDQIVTVDGSLPSGKVSAQVVEGIKMRLASASLHSTKRSEGQKWFPVA